MLLGILLILGLVFLDQITKYFAQTFLAGSPDVVFIPGLLEFGYYENAGASLSLFQGQQLLFAVVTVIALGAGGYLFSRTDFKEKRIFSLAVVFFIAGTLGNAIDRARFAYVIDFLHFPFLTPILNLIGLSNFYNNIADLVLSAAIVLFAIDLFIIDPKRSKEKAAAIQEEEESLSNDTN